MDVRKLPLEELELMSYDDIAYEILTIDEVPTNTASLFKEICRLLEMNDEAYAEKISDFYTLLMTDKRFFLLEDGSWDLSINHNSKIKLEDDDDEDEEIEEILEETEIEEVEEVEVIGEALAEEGVYADEDEELEDLVIVDEEDLEE